MCRSRLIAVQHSSLDMDTPSNVPTDLCSAAPTKGDQKTRLKGPKLEQSDVPMEKLAIKNDDKLNYLYDFGRDSSQLKELVEKAQQEERIQETWDDKYNLLDVKVFQKFADQVYNNSKNKCNQDIETLWKLLYRAKGKVFCKTFDGFFGEVYFNTENSYLMLAIKGSSTVGNLYSDFKNVVLNLKGGEINSAFTFAEKIRQLIVKFKCKPMLMITGHSLGGYLAQIITYTLTYCYLDVDGNVRSREEPTDEFGIYTVVFDSPAAFKQISRIDQHDPLDMQRFMLPVVNFVKDVNIVNSCKSVGPHLGLVLAIKDFKDLGKPGLCEKIANTLLSHGIINFDEVDYKQSQKVENLPKKRSVKYNFKSFPTHFLSWKLLERLKAYSFLAPLCAELMNKLPKFRQSASEITIEDEDTSVEEIYPRIWQILSQFKEFLDNGEVNGKKRFDMTMFNLWKAELKDGHDLQLNDTWRNRVQQWPNETIVGGFASYEEMRFFGCLIHNSLSNCYHYDSEKFQSMQSTAVNDFIATISATLILVVKDATLIKSLELCHRKMTKILYLVIGKAGCDQNVDLNLDDLDKRSQECVMHHEVEFNGSKVKAIDVFGNQFIHDLTPYAILSFQYENNGSNGNTKIDFRQAQRKFYYQQEISNEDYFLLFDDADEFALYLMEETPKITVIASNAGMGKSSALKRIACTLQELLPQYWIIYVDLPECDSEISNAQDTFDSSDAAMELIKTLTLGKNRAGEDLMWKLFDEKFKMKQMVILLDALDEICPKYRDPAHKLLEMMLQTHLQIVVTSRPVEANKLTCSPEDFFTLEYLRSDQAVSFIEEYLAHQYNGCKEFVSDISKNILPGVPLILTMIADILVEGGLEDSYALLGSGNYIELYEKCIEKSIQKSLTSLGFSQSAKCDDTYQEKYEIYKELLSILAICLILHGGVIVEEFHEKIGTREITFINRFLLASVDNCRVSFAHRSYAEHIVAKMCVQLLQADTFKRTILKETHMKSILLQNEYKVVRKYISEIIANRQCTLNPYITLNYSEKLKLLSNLIEEDYFDLYLIFKDVIDYKPEMRFEYCGYLSRDPFISALKKDRKDFMDEFLNAGSQLCEQVLILSDNSDDIAMKLRWALKNRMNETVKKNIGHFKACINDTVRDYEFDKITNRVHIIDVAICDENIEMVEFLMDNGAKLSPRSLDLAVEHQNQQMIDLLIDKRAEVGFGLQCAAAHGQLNLIVDSRYENIPREKRRNILAKALDKAVSNGHLQAVKYLCTLGAIPADLNVIENAEVFGAASGGHVDCLKFVIESGLHVDLRDRNSSTLLMFAAACGSSQLVTYLLEKEADVLAQNKLGLTCLHHASMGGNLTCVQKLLEAGAEINCKDGSGKTPLIHATHSHECVKYLLEKSANPEIVDKDGRSCLHHAAWRGATWILKLLADKVENMDCVDKDGWTPLHYASKLGFMKCAKILIEAGANTELKERDGRTSLHLAARHCRVHLLEYLIEKNANVNAEDNHGQTPLMLAVRSEYCLLSLLDESANFNNKDKFGATCLHHAAYYGNLKCVRLFIRLVENIDCTDDDGWTPLHHAVKRNSPENALLLLDAGANPNKANKDGKTSLHVAVQRLNRIGNFDTVELLVKYNANVNAIDKRGQSPLMLATRSVKCFIYLLRNSANLDVTDNIGRTCLHHAAWRGDPNCIGLIAGRVHTVDLPDKDEWTPLHYAAVAGSPNCTRLLLAAGANPNKRDMRGQSCLHLAIKSEILQVLKILVDRRADINAIDCQGRTPLMLAVKSEDCCRYLLGIKAKTNKVDKDGRTCLHHAVLFGIPEYVNLIAYQVHQIDCRDQEGKTALHYAAEINAPNTVLALLDAGANPNLKDKNGQTSLHLATQVLGNLDVVESLVYYYKADICAKDNEGRTALDLAEKTDMSKDISYYLRQKMNCLKE